MELAYLTGLSERDQVDLYLGVRAPLADPFLFFVRMDDLTNPRGKYIYYFGYSMGKKKIVLWGVYDRRDDEFIIESRCRYHPSDLISISRNWKNNGFSYLSNSVLDRGRQKILDNSGIGAGHDLIKNPEEYRTYKYIVSYFTDRITEEKLIRLTYEDVLDDLNRLFIRRYRISPLSDYYDFRFWEFLDEIEGQVKTYEQAMNRYDVDKAMVGQLGGDVKRAVERLGLKFTRFIESSPYAYSSYLSEIPECPARDACRSGDDKTCGVYNFGIHDFYGEEVELT